MNADNRCRLGYLVQKSQRRIQHTASRTQKASTVFEQEAAEVAEVEFSTTDSGVM